MAQKVEQETLTVDGREVVVTNPSKLLFAKAKVSKLDSRSTFLRLRKAHCEARKGVPAFSSGTRTESRKRSSSRSECRVLDEHDLVGWPKTSGSRGVHVLVRIERRWGFDEVRRAALALAREVERRAPALATSAWWKEERHGVFIDYNQNAKDRTVCSAYSVRPNAEAKVSTPVTWLELKSCDPGDFTIKSVPKRFAKIGDPHLGINTAVCSLDGLLELSAEQEHAGQGDAPWPPYHRKR